MREPALAACLLWPRALSDVSLDVSSGKFVGIGLEWGPKRRFIDCLPGRITMKSRARRRFMFRTTVALVGALCASAGVHAQPKEVKVAVVVPLSGAWARSGEFHVKGAELAVSHINAAGGIKALGGAKMRLVVADSGDSTEKAKNAAQRLVAQEPDLVGGTGACVSAFTLAVAGGTQAAEL